MVSQHEEVSSGNILRKLLEHKFCDVELEGTDGIKVPAVRAVLGAKSTTLEALLYGRFLEGKNAVVRLGFPGTILRAVVEYSHTDTSALLIQKQQTSSSEEDSEELTKQMEAAKLHIGILLQLEQAAIYFGLDGLSQKVYDSLLLYVKDPICALMLWLSCLEAGPAVSQEVQDLAWEVLRSRTDVVSCKAVQSLSVDSLELILKDEELMILSIASLK